MRETLEHVREWRRRFIEEVPFRVYPPSDANFVMIDVAPRTGGDDTTERLAAKGVLVRSCTSFPGGLGDHYIRVCIGEDWENIRFLGGAMTEI